MPVEVILIATFRLPLWDRHVTCGAPRPNVITSSVYLSDTHTDTHTYTRTHARTHTHTHTHEYLHMHTQHEDIPLQYCFQHPDLWRLQSCNNWHYISWVPHLRFGSSVCACVVCVCVCARECVCACVCVCVCLKRRQQEGSRNVICCHAVDVWASAPLHLCTQHFPWSRLFCCIWQQRFSCCYQVKYAAHTNGCVLVR